MEKIEVDGKVYIEKHIGCCDDICTQCAAFFDNKLCGKLHEFCHRNDCICEELTVDDEQPYIETKKVVTVREYNPNYGDYRTCKCGHTYYRHFDSWEKMKPTGCKYCRCSCFVEED